MPPVLPCYRSPPVWEVETEAGRVSLRFGFAEGFTLRGWGEVGKEGWHNPGADQVGKRPAGNLDQAYYKSN